MPLYEFYCADCKGRFEVLTSYEAVQSGSTVCTTCHGSNVRKLLSVVAKRSYGDGGDDFGDFGGGDFGDGDGDDFSGGGGCSCGGGACSCNN